MKKLMLVLGFASLMAFAAPQVNCADVKAKDAKPAPAKLEKADKKADKKEACDEKCKEKKAKHAKHAKHAKKAEKAAETK
jgi:hypothetical protein